MAYVYYNPNPKHRRTSDCVPRALAKALDMDWEQAYINIFSEGFNLSLMPNNVDVWKRLLRQYGFHTEIIPDTCPSCYTVRDFAYDHPYGIYVLAIVGEQNHVVTVADGDWYDTWDCGEEVPVFYMTNH